MSDRTDEQLNNVGKSAEEASITLDELSAAAKRADSMFDNAFLKVRSVTDGLNALGFTKLAKVFGVFEARFQTLARMSDYGASFGYNIQAMDQAALNARMSLSQLSNIVKESSETLTMFGMDTSDGAVSFTSIIDSMQTNVTRFGRTTEENARLLGYSFEALNETVLNYATISGLARSRERFDENARNRSMGEYLDTVDELAKLTGKQRDAISDTMVKEARQGQNIIRARQLGERGDDYMQFMGGFRAEFGDTLGDLNADMLTAGFGQTDETRKLQGVLSPLSNAMEQLRVAYEDPTSTDAQIKRMQDVVRSQAAGVSDLEVMNLAVYNRVNSTGGLLAQVITEQSALMAQTERYRDFVASQEGGSRTLSLEQARAELMQNTRDLQSGAMSSNADPNSPAGMFQKYIKAQIDLEKGVNTAKQAAIDGAYDNLAVTMSKLGTTFTTLNTRLLESSANFVDSLSAMLSDLGSMTGTQQAQTIAQTRATLSSLINNQDVGTEASQLLVDLATASRNINTAPDAASRQSAVNDMQAIIDRADQLSATARVIDIDNAEIKITNADLSRLIPGATPPGQMFGSMKTLGRLFNNYGEETMQPLHGLEAVTTPAQMADIVMNAAMGGRSALAQDIVSGISRASTSTASNSTARIDSMLNTVSSRLRDVVTTVAQENNTSPDTVINEFMNQLPKTLKTALEEAMGSSLRPSLEQLVNIGTQHAETSVKIRKSFSGITNDYMRSA
jgi:hypothetical protein|tara:strand:+ start:2690 stop:4894 length:2205 start_codon:yes stop_codon:yes gene_type:complete